MSQTDAKLLQKSAVTVSVRTRQRVSCDLGIGFLSSIMGTDESSGGDWVELGGREFINNREGPTL